MFFAAFMSAFATNSHSTQFNFFHTQARLQRTPFINRLVHDTVHLYFVHEDIREAVGRRPVSIQTAVFAPVLRFSILIFTDAFQVADIDATCIISMHRSTICLVRL